MIRDGADDDADVDEGRGAKPIEVSMASVSALSVVVGPSQSLSEDPSDDSSDALLSSPLSLPRWTDAFVFVDVPASSKCTY